MCSSRPLTSHLRVSTVSLRQMFGLCLACFGVLLLPMDVANRNSAFAAAVSSASGMWGGEQGEALPMTGLWEIVLVAIVIMVLGVIPFAIFYYEESGEGCALSRSVSLSVASH
jgi:uncharacterized membrane protein YidH (DUF202 family)